MNKDLQLFDNDKYYSHPTTQPINLGRIALANFDCLHTYISRKNELTKNKYDFKIESESSDVGSYTAQVYYSVLSYKSKTNEVKIIQRVGDFVPTANSPVLVYYDFLVEMIQQQFELYNGNPPEEVQFAYKELYERGLYSSVQKAKEAFVEAWKVLKDLRVFVSGQTKAKRKFNFDATLFASRSEIDESAILLTLPKVAIPEGEKGNYRKLVFAGIFGDYHVNLPIEYQDLRSLSKTLFLFVVSYVRKNQAKLNKSTDKTGKAHIDIPLRQVIAETGLPDEKIRKKKTRKIIEDMQTLDLPFDEVDKNLDSREVKLKEKVQEPLRSAIWEINHKGKEDEINLALVIPSEGDWAYKLDNGYIRVTVKGTMKQLFCEPVKAQRAIIEDKIKEKEKREKAKAKEAEIKEMMEKLNK